MTRPFASARAGASTSAHGKDTALAGPDGKKIESLLDGSIRHGAATLGTITESAVKRLLARGRPRSIKRLFNPEEKQQLADALSATLATGELLGRSRVRRRLKQAEKYHTDTSNVESFSEVATDFECFDESPIRPLKPQSAIDYFMSLIPELGSDPERDPETWERKAFTLAEDVEGVVLDKVQEALGRILDTGKGIARGKQIVQELLDEAGISPQNPGYAENVFRTNYMDAVTTGGMRELQDPDVVDSFPVWRYVGIRDGRQRANHEAHFERYYPSSTTFAEVRDRLKGSFDGYQCRCNFIPIFHKDWQRLQKEGAQAEAFAEKFDAGDWERYEGPRHGHGWRNAKTGEIIYGAHPGGGRPSPTRGEGAVATHASSQAAEEYKRLGTRARAFKAWFGDWEHDPAHASKVVDEHGEPKQTGKIPSDATSVVRDEHDKPIVVYHGTAHGGFQAFDPKKADQGALYGGGFYFTENMDLARTYTHVNGEYQLTVPMDKAREALLQQVMPAMEKAWQSQDGTWPMLEKIKRRLANPEFSFPFEKLGDLENLGINVGDVARQVGTPEVKAVYLNIRNPLDMDAPISRQRWEEFTDFKKWRAAHPNDDQFDDKPGKHYTGDSAFNWILNNGRHVGVYAPDYRDDAAKQFRKFGYDGFAYIGGNRMGKGKVLHRAWIAFAPTQIKGVDNAGTFDPQNPRIDMSEEDAVLHGELSRFLEQRTDKRGRKYCVEPGQGEVECPDEGGQPVGEHGNSAASPAEQYAKLGTKAPAFKAWFGDWQKDPQHASKVVDASGHPEQNHSIPGTGSRVTDEAGEPIVVYHGSQSEFHAFDPTKLDRKALYGAGFYFTANKNIAAGTWAEEQVYKQFASKEEAEAAQNNAPGLLKYIDPVRINGKWTAAVGYKQSLERPGYTQKGLAPVTDPAVRKKIADGLRDKIDALAPGYLSSFEKALALSHLDKFESATGDSAAIQGNLDWLTATLSGQPYNLRVLNVAADAGVNIAGHLYPCYLNIKRPFDIDNDKISPRQIGFGRTLDNPSANKFPPSAEFLAKQAALVDLLKQKKLARDQYREQYLQQVGALYEEDMDRPRTYQEYLDWGRETGNIGEIDPDDPHMERMLYVADTITRKLRSLGYDGLTHIGGKNTPGGVQHRVWIAFEPTQAKSVHNQGTFDPANPHIDMAESDLRLHRDLVNLISNTGANHE